MISLSEMTRRMRTKWERTFAPGTSSRKPSGFQSGAPEEFESRLLLSATAGSAVRIDAAVSNRVSTGDVDRIADGRSVAVWREEIDGATAILAQRFDATGAKTGAIIEVTDDFAANVTPAVAMANDGHFVVVWVSDETSVVGRQFQADGEAIDEVFDIGTIEGDAPSIVVDVDMDADGDFVVAWAAGPERITAVAYEAYDESAVFARRYAKTGNPVEAKFRVDTPTNDDVYLVSNPHVAMDADGDFAIGWSDVRENLVHKVVTYRYSGETYEYEYGVLTISQTDALVRRYQSNNFAQPAVAKATQTILSSTNPLTIVRLTDVDLDADGDMLVTMTRDSYRIKKVQYSGSTYEYLELKSSSVLVQRVNNSSTKVAKPKVVLSTKSTSQISDANAVLDNDGDFTIAYKENYPPYTYIEPGRSALPQARRHEASNTARTPIERDHVRSAEPRASIPDRLLVQNFNLKSKPVGGPLQLVSTIAGNLSSFSAVGTGTGELSVVWSLGGAETDGKLFGQRVTT